MTKARPRPALRRTALAGIAVAALGLTAACGSSNDSSDGSAPSGAASSASGSPSAGASGGTAGNAFAPGTTVDAASVKKMFTDATSAAGTVHVDLEMAGQIELSGSGDMDMKSSPVKADLKLSSTTLGGDGIRMLMVDDAMYLHLPQLGDKYAKVSLSGKDSPLGQMGLSSLDPTAMFDTFSDAVSSGTYVGKETVDGTSADHYRFTLDTKAIASALPSLSASSSAVPGTETVDVWFDGDGRYKQMKIETGGETVTETFSDWGKAVTVKAPPANQVQDMSSLASGMMGSQGQ